MRMIQSQLLIKTDFCWFSTNTAIVILIFSTMMPAYTNYSLTSKLIMQFPLFFFLVRLISVFMSFLYFLLKARKPGRLHNMLSKLAAK